MSSSSGKTEEYPEFQKALQYFKKLEAEAEPTSVTGTLGFNYKEIKTGQDKSIVSKQLITLKLLIELHKKLDNLSIESKDNKQLVIKSDKTYQAPPKTGI